MTTIAAIHQLKNVKQKILLSIGFGVDSYHGVNHSLVLENIAQLIKQGGFLGCFSLHKDMEEAQKMNKCFLACQPSNSIVNTSITSAMLGEFGDYHHPATRQRTQGSKLFINPLMCIYWCFHLDHVAKNIHFIDRLVLAKTRQDVVDVIRKWREKCKIRKNIAFPH